MRIDYDPLRWVVRNLGVELLPTHQIEMKIEDFENLPQVRYANEWQEISVSGSGRKYHARIIPYGIYPFAGIQEFSDGILFGRAVAVCTEIVPADPREAKEDPFLNALVRIEGELSDLDLPQDLTGPEKEMESGDVPMFRAVKCGTDWLSAYQRAERFLDTVVGGVDTLKDLRARPDLVQKVLPCEVSRIDPIRINEERMRDLEKMIEESRKNEILREEISTRVSADTFEFDIRLVLETMDLAEVRIFGKIFNEPSQILWLFEPFPPAISLPVEKGYFLDYDGRQVYALLWRFELPEDQRTFRELLRRTFEFVQFFHLKLHGAYTAFYSRGYSLVRQWGADLVNTGGEVVLPTWRRRSGYVPSG